LPPNKIIKKLKRAVTDSDMDIQFDRDNKPGVSNLLELMAGVTDKTIDEIVADAEEALANESDNIVKSLNFRS